MKTSKLLACLVLVAPVSCAWAAPQVDPDKLPKVDCTAIKYSAAFLEKYPDVPAACLEARVYQGTTYAKLKAKVYINNLPDFITLQLLNVAGTMVTTFSVKPKPGMVVHVDGKPTKPEDLKVGQEITLWVPEGRMEADALPGATEQAWNVIPPAKK